MSGSNKISLESMAYGVEVITNYPHYLYQILSGEVEFEMKLALFCKIHNGVPKSVESVESDEIVRMTYNQLVSEYRDQLQQAMESEASRLAWVKQKEEAKKKAEEYKKAGDKFKKINSVAPEGTVDELSKKYGVSKSKIRELKREGRLHELVGGGE